MKNLFLVSCVILLSIACTDPNVPIELKSTNVDIDTRDFYYVHNGTPLNGYYKIMFYDSDYFTVSKFKNGSPIDTLRSYYSENQLKRIAYFPNGVNNGVETWYYPDGGKWSEVPYVDNKKNGDELVFFNKKEDKIQVITTFKDNVEIGKKEFFSDGKVSFEMTSNEETGQTKRVWYFANGGVQKLANYKNGKRDGEQLVYEKKGVLKKKIFYKDDVLKEMHKYKNGVHTETYEY